MRDLINDTPLWNEKKVGRDNKVKEEEGRAAGSMAAAKRMFQKYKLVLKRKVSKKVKKKERCFARLKNVKML